MKRKNLIFGVLTFSFILFISLALFISLHKRLNRCIVSPQINLDKPMVALTFDDGPNPKYTPKVLDLLYKNQIHATFFIVGKNFKGNELLIKEMVSSGHELENHTFSHPDFVKLDKYNLEVEISKMEEELKKILPNYSIDYIRPHYGKYTKKVESSILHPLVLWTIDSKDCRYNNSDEIYNKVISNVKDGDIIVFHDNKSTIEALKRIIAKLRENDFQFVTVSQLYKYKNK